MMNNMWPEPRETEEREVHVPETLILVRRACVRLLQNMVVGTSGNSESFYTIKAHYPLIQH